MKKYLFIVPIALMAQYISAQALTKNGSIVTESTVSTLKVGDVTYPNTDGTYGQVLTTDGAGTASWTTPPSGSLASVFEGVGLILNYSHSGAIIDLNASNINNLFNDAIDLPDGFTCTLINTYSSSDSDYLFVSSPPHMNVFFYQVSYNSYSSSIRNNYTYFNIKPSGTVRVSVITVFGQKRIYLTGDLMDDPA
jgi:hypothetical protein